MLTDLLLAWFDIARMPRQAYRAFLEEFGLDYPSRVRRHQRQRFLQLEKDFGPWDWNWNPCGPLPYELFGRKD